MTAKTTALRATRGDTEVYTFTVERASGPVDLTGRTVRFVARPYRDSPDPPTITKAATIPDQAASPGVCRVTLLPADTATLDAPLRLSWDLELDEAGVISTVDRGFLYVDADVAR